jgi:uncharacterized protein
VTVPIYTRQFATAFEVRDFNEPGDGRTVYGRIVPYGDVISYVDPYDGGAVKRERFVKGVFARQSDQGAWSRVVLTFQHHDGFTNTIGYGRRIDERDDGAYATFRLYEADAAKAREMIETGHDGLSVEFEPRGTEELDAQGVIVRRRVHLRRVGITNDPAYQRAEVLSVRERSDVPTPRLDEVRAELERLRNVTP